LRVVSIVADLQYYCFDSSSVLWDLQDCCWRTSRLLQHSVLFSGLQGCDMKYRLAGFKVSVRLARLLFSGLQGYWRALRYLVGTGYCLGRPPGNSLAAPCSARAFHSIGVRFLCSRYYRFFVVFLVIYSDSVFIDFHDILFYLISIHVF
jgi:hypothetical protein